MSATYWRTHNAFALWEASYIPWSTYLQECPAALLRAPFDESTPLSAYFPGSHGRLAALNMLDVLQAPSGLDPCADLAAEWVVATLNRCRGACASEAVDAELTAAPQTLGTQCFGPRTPTVASDIAASAAVLRAFNGGDGALGPGVMCARPELAPARCTGGCVLPAEYWATYSRRGELNMHRPWPLTCVAADNVAGMPEDNVLYGGTTTWYDALTALASADACVVGARQFTATSLNLCARGACSPPSVLEALGTAQTLLGTYCGGGDDDDNAQALVPDDLLPVGLSEARVAEIAAVRRALLEAATALQQFNMGGSNLLGPGLCVDSSRGGVSASSSDEVMATFLGTMGHGMKTLGTGSIITIALLGFVAIMLTAFIVIILARQARFNAVVVANGRAVRSTWPAHTAPAPITPNTSALYRR